MNKSLLKFLGSLALTSILGFSAIALNSCKQGNSASETEHDGSSITLSANGGVYEKEFILYATPSNKENKIFYSLDGTSSEKATKEYTASGIAIKDQTKASSYPLTNGINDMGYGKDKTGCGTVIRFSERTPEGKEISSKTVTYIIDPAYVALQEEDKIPVVCLTAEKSVWLGNKKTVGFYDDVNNEDRKERMELEYYDASTQETFAFSTQVKLGGNWTKLNYPKRTFNLNWKWADDKKTVKNEKLSKLGVHIFGKDAKAQNGKDLQNVTQVRLHSGGNAFASTNYSDALTQDIASLNENVSTAAARACLLYLNGEFWGYYTIREHYSDSFFENNFSVDKDNVIYCDRSTTLEVPNYFDYNIKTFDSEKESVTINGETMTQLDYARKCLDELYDVLWQKTDKTYLSYSPNGNFYVNQRLITDMGKNAESYEKLCEIVDVDSLIDCILIEAYVGNWDFFYNNMRIWRVADPSIEKKSNPYADGKWRFCLHDLDFSFEDENGKINISGGNVLESYTGLHGAANNTTGMNNEMVASLLAAPMLNENFRIRFNERAKAIEQLFRYENGSNAKKVFSSYENIFNNYLTKEYDRWGGLEHNKKTYRSAINKTEQVLLQRGNIFLQQVDQFVADYAALDPSPSYNIQQKTISGTTVYSVSPVSANTKIPSFDDLFGKDFITETSGVSITFKLRNSYTDWNTVFSTQSVIVHTGVVEWKNYAWYEGSDDLGERHDNNYWKKLLYDSPQFNNRDREIVVTASVKNGVFDFYRNGQLVYRYNSTNNNGNRNGNATMFYAVNNLISECKACGITWNASGMQECKLVYIGKGVTESQAKAIYDSCK